MAALRTTAGAPVSTSPDPLDVWIEELRGALVSELDQEQVAVVARAAAGSAGAGLAASATAAGHAFAKVVAAGALVTLAAGGAAAVTGSLPTGLQARVSDSAARVGIELPDPRLEGGIRIGADQTIRVGEAGQVQVGLRDGALSLGDVQASAGWTASVRTARPDRALVAFSSDDEQIVLEITVLDGRIETEVTSRSEMSVTPPEVTVRGGLSGEAEGETEGSGAVIDLESEGTLQVGTGH